MTGWRPIVGIALGLAGLASLVACGDVFPDRANGGSPTRAPTYAKDVAPILFERCASCHHSGGSAPFSVLDYDAVRKRARQIATVTETRVMPPWLPEPGYGAFAGERRLTDQQIDTIRRWVDQGTPEGNQAELPQLPQLTGGWQLGQPDLVVKLPRPYTLQAGTEDVWRNFVIPVPIPGTRFVRTVELRPGSARYVHHALVGIDETRSSRRRDEQDAALGFEGMDMGEAHMPEGSLLGWTPGMLPFPGIEGTAWALKPGTDLVLQLHMMPSEESQIVDPVVGFYFARTPGLGAPTYVLMLDADDDLDIPAGAKDFVVTDAMDVPVDVEVLAVYPHAHYVGKSVDSWATLPDGTRRSLIRIGHWDFKWQDVYRYAQPLPLPKGTKLTMQWSYDNSGERAHEVGSALRHPHSSHPPTRVVAGNRSTNEMAHLLVQVRLRSHEDRMALNEAYFRHLMRKRPDKARVLYGLASALKDQGRWAEAASQYRATLAIEPGHLLAHNNLGAVLMEQGHTDEAVTHFRAALQLDPDFSGAHYNLAIALGSQGRVEEAIRQYRNALRWQPDFAEAHNNLGQALGSLGRLDEAIPHLREAVRLMPDSAETHNNLGTGLWFLGKREEAIGEFRRALEIDPDHASALKNLSTALQTTSAGGVRP